MYDLNPCQLREALQSCIVGEDSFKLILQEIDGQYDELVELSEGETEET